MTTGVILDGFSTKKAISDVLWALVEELKKTSLWDEHVALKARMVPFAGYHMPVQYQGVIPEHEATRQHVSLCDVSHMGIARAEGPEARKFINYALAKDVTALKPGHALYTVLCRANGNTVDDLIVYCEGEEKFFFVLNASNKEKDLNYLRELAKNFAVKLEDDFEKLSLLALQGPKSEALLQKMGLKEPLSPAFTFFRTELAGIPVLISRTGYTGEVGCEIAVANAQAPTLWKKLLSVGESFGIKPCGLAARDTLRTEMGYSLYGHEITEEINPVEAGLGWVLSLNKDFVGREALQKAKAQPQRKLVALKNNSKQAPRPDMKVQDATGQVVGFITSGTFAPSLGHAIGLALVTTTSQAPYSVVIRDQAVPFEITKRPFYQRSEKHV